MKRFGMGWRLLVMMAVVAVFVGCGEQRDKTTFIVVNEHPICASDVKDCVLIKAKVSELAGSPVAADDFAEWANKKAMEIFGSMIEVELLRQEIANKGVCPKDIDYKITLAEYNRQLGLKAESVDALAAKFGEQGDVFKRQFNLAASIAAYARIYWKSEVSDKMIDYYFVHLTNAMEVARGIDSQAHANAEKAYARLMDGEEWQKVAVECSEDRLLNPDNERFAKEWLTVTKEAYGIKQLADILPSMREGEFTRPIDTRDGLIIFRLLEIGNEGTYRLARILFRMADSVAMPSSREEARKTIAEQMEYAGRKATMDRLRKNAQFGYPMGTNFTYEIWKTGGSR